MNILSCICDQKSIMFITISGISKAYCEQAMPIFYYCYDLVLTLKIAVLDLG